LREFEYGAWREIFDATTRILSTYRGPEDWERVKRLIAEEVAKLLLRRFHTIRRIALADLSGGECASDSRPSLDIDLLVVVDSPAEAYALKSLEQVLDNAIREAFIHTLPFEEYKKLATFYKRGLHHNLLEVHVNDLYARSKSRDCPPIELYAVEPSSRAPQASSSSLRAAIS